MQWKVEEEFVSCRREVFEGSTRVPVCLHMTAGLTSRPALSENAKTRYHFKCVRNDCVVYLKDTLKPPLRLESLEDQ